ncbi:WbqC family protein [Methylomonas sp. MO1]|uniref:WbqC family protein n=1 Tax=unclassified Methylomonas TaxID=2608980 RepID=UPI00047AD1A1|nr:MULTISPECIES: WbqC family protein [unclassified Methylomonas]MDT4291374.1 WbqC family protein [Methylomonas sp. MO1]
MKSLAVMQPYFFPYIGYWQLMHAVDRFVIYDDVNYITRGWINRNRLLINGKPNYITVPLNRASQNKHICEIQMLSSNWRNKILKSIEITYKKSPFYCEVFPIIDRIIRYKTDSLSDYLRNQLETLASFLSIKTEFRLSSLSHKNNALSGQERILDICKREGVTTYINLQGGQDLYDIEAFRAADIDLRIIVMKPFTYKQRSIGFTPSLSIIDVLMEVGPVDTKNHLNAVHLISNEKKILQ